MSSVLTNPLRVPLHEESCPNKNQNIFFVRAFRYLFHEQRKQNNYTITMSKFQSRNVALYKK